MGIGEKTQQQQQQQQQQRSKQDVSPSQSSGGISSSAAATTSEGGGAGGGHHVHHGHGQGSHHSAGHAALRKKHSSQKLVEPAQVTEQTLQVWRALPAQIRHDPSMVSFQLENERLHGSIPTDDDSSFPIDNESGHEEDEDGSEFIQMRRLPKPPPNNADLKSDGDGDGDGTLSDIEHGTDPTKSVRHRVQEKQKSKQRHQRERLWKRTGLLIFWLFAASALMMFDEKFLLEKTLEVPANHTKNFLLLEKPTGDFKLKIFGTFNDTAKASNDSTLPFLTIQTQIADSSAADFEDILYTWHVPLVPEQLFDVAPVVTRNYTFKVPAEMLERLDKEPSRVRLALQTNADKDFALQIIYNPLIINARTGTLLAAGVLMIFYGLLVWEVFERPFVAIVCSILSVAVLACFNDRPNMEEIIQWMDMEMLTLLFCMMVIVGILTETGVFDYIAVVAFELSGGKIWPMIYSLCFLTCFVSSFLDNVTTVLLMTPVAIRLCEVMSLDPVPVLMGIIAHSNIGGSLTPIGDPMSIIICSNHFIANNGMTFTKFVTHTIPGVILTSIQSCLYLRFVFRDPKSLRLNEPKEIKELRREIKVWQRAANSISAFSKDADIVRQTLSRKVKILKHTLRRKQRGLDSTDAYVHTLEDLKLKYPIKNKVLLMQACGALVFVIICFFIQSVPDLRTLPLGWVALLGVIALLIILNRDDMEHIMHRIEWTTLLFFAAMFVMMECLERLGIFTWIGKFTEHIILMVEEQYRLGMAICIIVWISAIASSVLDSIPVTAMMVKVVISLVSNEALGLPLQPLVWALAFGPCLGGNGTLYGASSNVISAGIAEQHGYKLSFTRYLKIGFPMMLGQVAIITAYLLVAHVIWQWH